MLKYIKLSVLNISVVSLVALVIWLVMDYKESNGINLSILGFIVLLIVLLSYLIKDVWNTYDELKKEEHSKD